MSAMAFKMRNICIIMLIGVRNYFIHSETVIRTPISNLISRNHHHHHHQKDAESNRIFDQPNMNDVTVIIERMTRLESIVLDHRLKFEKYQDEIKEEVKVMRNATLLLLSLVSGRGSECQGLKDTASKVKILYAALAAYEPSLNYPSFDGDLVVDENGFEPPYGEHFEQEEGTDEMVEKTVPPATPSAKSREQEESSEKEIGLESGDLVWDSLPDSTTNFSSEELLSSTLSSISSSSIGSTDSMMIPSTIAPATTETTTIRTVSLTKGRMKTTRAPILCPRGSKLVGRECFSVHLDLQLNWTSARTFCRKLGGDLAEPKLHNDKLPRQLLKTWPAFGESSYWTLWVGATDQEKEGEWHWVTGGPLNLNESSRWDVEEAPEVGESQDCLAMILWVPGRWQRWDLLDDPCDLEWFFFCEYSP